jgi:hypothetical protein
MTNSYSQEFKRASIGLLLTIIQNVNPKNSNKYYKFLQKELHIDSDEFEEILELQEFTQSHNIVVEDEIDTVRKELEYKRHQIMKFLMMLNRCIIIDGCDVKNYQKFEKIRDSFLAKL